MLAYYVINMQLYKSGISRIDMLWKTIQKVVDYCNNETEDSKLTCDTY